MRNFGGGQVFEGDALGFDFLEVEEEEAGGVPDFVGEGAGAQDAVFAEDDVGAGGGHAGEHVAHGVGAVLVGELEGVDAGAFCFGHFGAFGGADEGVEVEAVEGNYGGES